MQAPALYLRGASSPRVVQYTPCGVTTPRAVPPFVTTPRDACIPRKDNFRGACTSQRDSLGDIPDEHGIPSLGQSPLLVQRVELPASTVQSPVNSNGFSALQQSVLLQIVSGIAKDVAQKASELTYLATELPTRFGFSAKNQLAGVQEGGNGGEIDSVILSQRLDRNENSLQEGDAQSSTGANEFTTPQKFGSMSKNVSKNLSFESLGERDSLLVNTFHLKLEWQRDLSIEEAAQAVKSSKTKMLDPYRLETPYESGTSSELGSMKSLRPSRSSICGVASPTHPSRLAWEIFGLTLITYDLIHIPLFMTFPLPATRVIDIIDWVALLFWTANILVSIQTGFFAKGVLVLSRKMILIHYLKTWFVVDTFTVVNHWFLTISRITEENDDHGGGSFANSLQLLRFMRLARLLRLFKLGRVWELIHDFTFGSQTLEIILEVAKMLLALLLVIHFTACLWYLIGDSDTSKTWIKFHGFALEEVEWTDQYLVAYHWSLTQFTPASMHVQPQNGNERIFAIFVVISGLVGFSYLVGSINLSLGRLRLLGEQKSKKFRQLRHFLQLNRVPLDLSTRIRNHAEGRWDDQQTHRREANIVLLSFLSEHLKNELAWALRRDYLRAHPLFGLLETSSSVTMKRIAYKGFSQLSMAPGDVLFVVGELATHMSLLTMGHMQYFRTDTPMPQDLHLTTDVIAEPVVWTIDWHHRGDLKSKTPTELLMMDPKELMKITAQSPVAYQTVKAYANRYVQILNDTDSSCLSDISTSEILMSHLQSITEVSATLGMDWACIGTAVAAERARNKLLSFIFPGGLARNFTSKSRARGSIFA